MLSPCGWTLFCTSSIRMEKTREREFMRSRAIFVPFSADDHQSIQHVSLSIETFPHLSPSSHSLHSFTSDALSSVASSNQYSFQCYRETEKEEECSLLVSHGQCEISFNGNLNKIDRSKKNKYDIWMSRRVSSIDRCRSLGSMSTSDPSVEQPFTVSTHWIKTSEIDNASVSLVKRILEREERDIASVVIDLNAT